VPDLACFLDDIRGLSKDLREWIACSKRRGESFVSAQRSIPNLGITEIVDRCREGGRGPCAAVR